MEISQKCRLPKIMRELSVIFPIVLMLACSYGSDEKIVDAEKQKAVQISNVGPRGSIYTDATGKQFAFRSFRTRIMNDSSVPMILTINFSNEAVALLPQSDRLLRVFLLPDSMKPEVQFGLQFKNGAFIQPLNSIIDTSLKQPSGLRIKIAPKKDYYLNIGTVFYPADGLVRAGIFVNGQKHAIPLVPLKSIDAGTKKIGELQLVFGIGLTEPANYALIPCGGIDFKK